MTPAQSGPPRPSRPAAGATQSGDEPGSGTESNRSEHPREAPAASDPAAGTTRGMAMVQQAVTFTNAQVLDPTAHLSGTIKPTGMDVGADALADSAGAMMLQDMRTYLQSTEMILVPVAAAAFAEILAGNDKPGQAALTGIQDMLGYLTTFSANVIENAATIQADFG